MFETEQIQTISHTLKTDILQDCPWHNKMLLCKTKKKEFLARIECFWIIRFIIFNTLLWFWGFTRFFKYWKIKGSSWKWPIFLYPVIIIHYNMKTLDFADTGSTRAWMASAQFLVIVSWDQVRSCSPESRAADQLTVDQWWVWAGLLARSEVKLVWKQDAQQVTLTNWEDRDGAFALCHSCWQILIRK